MAIKQLTSIVEGFFIEPPDFALEGRTVGLAGNGMGQWQATSRNEVEGELGVFLRVTGPPGTDWKLSIACTGAEKPFFVKSGSTNSKGFYILLDSTPCNCKEEK